MAARCFASCLSICALLSGTGVLAVDRIDPRHFDPKAEACTDLYQFANGGWLASTPVPPGLQRNDWRVEQSQTVAGQQQQLLLGLRSDSDDALEASVATLIASVQNEESLPGARQQALAALLPALEQIQRPAHVRELLTRYQQRGLPLLFFARRAGDSVIIETDLLTLPDPQFYLSPHMQGEVWRSRLGQYIEELLQASGSTDLATETAWALDFEMKLAEAMRRPSPTNLSLRELDQRTPGLEWKPLLKALDLDDAKQFRVSDFSPFPTVNTLIAEAHPVQWKSWLRFRIVHLLAPYLDAPFRDPHDRLIRAQLLQQTLPISSEQRAHDLAQRLLGTAIRQLYAERQVGEAERAAIEQLWAALTTQLGAAIERHPDWSDKTRQRAADKLAAVRLQIGPQQARPDLGKLRLAADNLPGNALALLRWRQQHMAPPEDLGWLQYRPEHNQLQLAAGALQRPLFDPAAEPALQYGGLGVLLAHELIHGFDLGGASFDAAGAQQPWWSEQERAGFLTRVAALDQAQGLSEPLLGNTRYERAADLAALRLSFAAFLAQPAGSSERLHGLSAEQRFFVAWASQLRENVLPSTAAPEWPSAQRVNAALPWVPGFAAAYSCRTSQALAPEFWP
ncbi:M13 family metallopeptidase [Pseudomarimonas arenosa]|uniref:M13 family metallopeptidase n=1 Tax=Pseudomarimonas arenosa TaxID=2774145 RepID=A0AAW3ZPU5_9GAMM|nr:M13 family metallopeptidase [Pseudomarimonas arenosa]MBD8527738.1 M13 family metallopeptidase [Pseudomarimonas arenosa]